MDFRKKMDLFLQASYYLRSHSNRENDVTNLKVDVSGLVVYCHMAFFIVLRLRILGLGGMEEKQPAVVDFRDKVAFDVVTNK